MFHFIAAVDCNQQRHKILDQACVSQRSGVDRAGARKHRHEFSGYASRFGVVGADEHIAIDPMIELRQQVRAEGVKGGRNARSLR